MINIIIQGGIWPNTINTAKLYISHPTVSKVILSMWEDDPVEVTQDMFPSGVIVVKNKKPDYEGPGNLNLHLLSSRNGLKHCDQDIIIKIRSDEEMSHEGITQWVQYFLNHGKENTLEYLDGTHQQYKIGVIATNIRFPYHPQDHVFIGHKQDLKKLFDMPFSMEPPIGPEPVDFSIHLQNPIYIGANYFSLFFPEAKKHLDNWKDYLLMKAPKQKEAMDFYLKHRNSIFLPLPRIKMWWQKFNCEYWWDGYYNGGDRYAGEDE